ncbi:MAG: hypothetical protein ACQEP1_06775 [Nanobdellota archaeon]
MLLLLLSCNYVLAEEGNTTLEIESTAPQVTNVHMFDSTKNDNKIELTADDSIQVNCTADVTDLNGNSDIKKVSAEIYGPSSSFGAGDSNNNHYTNSSCNYDSSAGSAHCMFPDVEFYAEPGEWHCQINATDYAGKSNHSERDNTTVLELLAMDISNHEHQDHHIDFGNVAPGFNSSEEETYFMNDGNVEYNVNIDAYNDSGTGINDTVAMDCETGTLSPEAIRVDNDPDIGLNELSKTGTISLDSFYVKTARESDTNKRIYWKIEIPDSGVSGECTGKSYLEAFKTA